MFCLLGTVLFGAVILAFGLFCWTLLMNNKALVSNNYVNIVGIVMLFIIIAYVVGIVAQSVLGL